MEQRRLGCAWIVDKSGPKCSLPTLHSLLVSDMDEGTDEMSQEQLETEGNYDWEPEEAMVSLHATTNNSKVNSMRKQGRVGGKAIIALVDSGSTHCFIDPEVLGGTNFPPLWSSDGLWHGRERFCFASSC